MGRTAARLLILIALPLGLTGCFEIHEDLWVRQDGTVRYALDYAVPEYVLAMSEADSATDSSFADLSRPAREVIEGDSAWSREYVDGDLHHFLSERQIESLDRFTALSAREDARRDSADKACARYAEVKRREYAHRDSVFNRALHSGPAGQATRDSIMHVMGQPDATTPPKFQERTGIVAGGYRSQPAGKGLLRLRHEVGSKCSFGVSRGRSEQRQYAGRTYVYRLHAPEVVSSNGARSPDGTFVEWSLPMSALGDSSHAMEAVIRVK